MPSRCGATRTARFDALCGLPMQMPTFDARRPAAEPLRKASAEAAIRSTSSGALIADETNDRALDHALTYALIEIGDAKATAKGLDARVAARPPGRPGGAGEHPRTANLEAKTVLAELDAKDAALRETAWWIAGRHPQWGDQLAGYFAREAQDRRQAEAAKSATNSPSGWRSSPGARRFRR